MPSSPLLNFLLPFKAPSILYSPPLKTLTLFHPSNQSPTPLQSSAQSVLCHSGPSSSPRHPFNHRTGSSPASDGSSLYHWVFQLTWTRFYQHQNRRSSFYPQSTSTVQAGRHQTAAKVKKIARPRRVAQPRQGRPLHAQGLPAVARRHHQSWISRLCAACVLPLTPHSAA